MKNALYALLLIWAVPAVFTSCSDDNEIVLYSDCYIGDFTLGTVKRLLHTTSSKGEDSTYVTTFAGSYYRMHIDQLEQTIHNSDSLPYESLTGAIRATVSGSGNVFYRKASEAEENWTLYSSSDSIDFREKLIFMVISSDGTARKEYAVQVNVHKQDGDEFVWNKLGEVGAFAGLDEARLVQVDNRMLLLGRSGNDVRMAVTETNNGKDWVQVQPVGCGDADVRTLQVFRDEMYLSTPEGSLLRSADGTEWETLSTAGQLVASDKDALYVLRDGGLYRSADGLTWEVETLDDTADKLPARNISSLYYTQPNGDGRLMMVGNRTPEDFPADTAAVVWGKTFVNGQSAVTPWVYYIVAPENKRTCPQLEHLNLMRFGEALVVAGGASVDGERHRGLDALYFSNDNGITWFTNTDFTTPPPLRGTKDYVAAAVDSDSFIWIVCGTQVWKGRYVYMGFEQQ